MATHWRDSGYDHPDRYRAWLVKIGESLHGKGKVFALNDLPAEIAQALADARGYRDRKHQPSVEAECLGVASD